MDATFMNGDLMNRTYRKLIQEAEMNKDTRVWCGSGDLAPRGGAKVATETPARVSIAGGLSFFLSHDSSYRFISLFTSSSSQRLLWHKSGTFSFRKG
jgi:hypothetical protein